MFLVSIALMLRIYWAQDLFALKLYLPSYQPSKTNPNPKLISKSRLIGIHKINPEYFENILQPGEYFYIVVAFVYVESIGSGYQVPF